jgi:hypothetical protein
MIKKICVLEDFGSDNYFVFNSCIHESVHVYRLGSTCVEIQGVNMLTLFDGLCCVGFLNPIGVVAGVRRQRLALSIAPI